MHIHEAKPFIYSSRLLPKTLDRLWPSKHFVSPGKRRARRLSHNLNFSFLRWNQKATWRRWAKACLRAPGTSDKAEVSIDVRALASRLSPRPRRPSIHPSVCHIPAGGRPFICFEITQPARVFFEVATIRRGLAVLVMFQRRKFLQQFPGWRWAGLDHRQEKHNNAMSHDKKRWWRLIDLITTRSWWARGLDAQAAISEELRRITVTEEWNEPILTVPNERTNADKFSTSALEREVAYKNLVPRWDFSFSFPPPVFSCCFQASAWHGSLQRGGDIHLRQKANTAPPPKHSKIPLQASQHKLGLHLPQQKMGPGHRT